MMKKKTGQQLAGGGSPHTSVYQLAALPLIKLVIKLVPVTLLINNFACTTTFIIHQMKQEEIVSK
jgi:hypothetical protein